MTVMGKGGRRKTVPVVVDSNDPFAKYVRTYFVRGNPVMTLAPLGPAVPASTPEELEERTDEAIVKATKDEEPS
jgi:hypothetical protein